MNRKDQYSQLALQRKEAVPVKDLLKIVLDMYHVTAGLNTHMIYSAWDRASGAEKYTVRRFFRDGRLYITVDSSVVRSQLAFQKPMLVERMNSILSEDEMFSRNCPEANFVKELIIK
jgi:hypothetical protein